MTPIRAILLCAGTGSRFGGGKLLAAAAGSSAAVGVRAAQSILDAVGHALAVVRPGDERLRRMLEEAGCEVLETPDAIRGIGASLAAGVKASPGAAGWLIALGDMPLIRPATHRALAESLARGAKLAATADSTGRRGHPVGFSKDLYADLAALDGDEGARCVIERHRAWLEVVRVNDPGIFVDIDMPGDLAVG
ncbi:MAG: nucleotidyltransferase family protein [Betaproteobacteria bacterium]|nr:nucleotidyltransferase family protein [Betaproteobacteria bacterium]